MIPDTLRPVPGGYRLCPVRPGPPEVLLLPGVEGDSRVFCHLDPLARRRSVLAMDLLTGHRTLQEQAAALLAAVPSERFTVLGVSLGGLIGWAMSLLEPARIRGIVTLGTLPHASCIPPRLSSWAALLRRLPQQLVRPLYRRRINARMREEGVGRLERDMLLSRLPSGSVLAERLSMVDAWGLQPPPVASLWLSGQHDTEVRWSLQDAQRFLPDTLAQVVPGGHRAHLTHPVPLCGFVEHFLRGIR